MSMARDRLRASRRGTSSLGRVKLVALVTTLALVLIAMWQLSLVVEKDVWSPASSDRAAPLAVTATFVRASDIGDIPVRDGDRVEPGDRLGLHLVSESPVHAYVLDEDEAGEMFVLFPAPGLDVTNPLAADSTHRLPGSAAGAPQDWVVTSAGGAETLLLICAPHPLSALEQTLASLPAVDPDRPVTYAPLRATELSGLRGVTGVQPIDVDAVPPGERLMRMAEAARGSELYVTRVRLHNP